MVRSQQSTCSEPPRYNDAPNATEPPLGRGGPGLAGLPARGELVAGLALVAALALAYASAVGLLLVRWRAEPEYSHGFLVPLFAGLLLWLRRPAAMPTLQGSWWGLLPLGVSAAMRWTSAGYYFDLLDPASLLICLLGLALLVGGWPMLRWAWPAVAFLAFMIPLPGFVAGTLSLPLQRVATVAGTYVLQTLGVPAASQGNVILLTETQLGVVEACSGLRMLMTFLAVCAAVAMIVERPLWERLALVASAVPIALVANILRIALTGILYETTSAELARAVYHDFAGWLMMPLALGLVWAELRLIRFGLRPPAPQGPLALGPASPPRGPQRSARRRKK